MNNLIDLTGKRFGSLKVMGRAGTQSDGRVTWFCHCDCGGSRVAIGKYLRNGESTSCGCERTAWNKGKIKSREGVVSGKIIGLNSYQIRKGIVFWLCKCECGKEFYSNANRLDAKALVTCGCGSKSKFGSNAIGAVWCVYKRNAKTRNLEFTLSFGQFMEIIQSPCRYCGEALTSLRKTDWNTPNFNYTGIDRVDSHKGYTPDNCVPCCAVCNWMKRDMPVEEFYRKITRIHQHWISAQHA